MTELILPKRFEVVQYREAEVMDATEQGEVRLRVVPYEAEAQIGQDLFEVFTRGAFANAANAPSRAKLWAEHKGALIGAGKEAEDLEDGFYLTAKFANTVAGQEARSMVLDGIYDSCSVEFRPMQKFMNAVRRASNILVRHDKAHMLGVALVGYPAYELSQVVSARDDKRENEREQVIARLKSMNH